MRANVIFVNGHSLQLDEFATDMFLQAVHKNELGNSLIIMHIGDKTGKLKYSIPLNSVVYVEYID